MKALDACRKQAALVDVGATIAEAAQTMNERVVGSLVVTDGDRPVGIVTDRDLVTRALAREMTPGARVDGVMSAELVTFPAGGDLHEAIQLFRTHAIRRLPLMADDGTLAGVLSVDDLLIDLTSDLGAVLRPITGEVLFGQVEQHGEVVAPG